MSAVQICRAGMLAALVVLMVIAADSRVGASAEGLFDIFGGGGGFFGAPPQAPAPRAPERRRSRRESRGPDAPDSESGRRSRKSRGSVSFRDEPSNRRPRSAAVRQATPLTVHKARASGGDDGDGGHASASQGHFSVCIRLCDGYVFPIGDFNGSQDRAAQESTCHVGCPGADTALYLMNGDMDTIGSAVRAGTHATYASLPTAFKYTKGVDPKCTCHAPGASRVASILHDYTLRRGDAVMTNSGFKIFHGGAYPFKPRDFSPLLASRDIPKEHRAILEVMERVMTKQAGAAKPTKEPVQANAIPQTSPGVSFAVLHRRVTPVLPNPLASAADH